jgi:hypothetical protein
MYEYFLHSHVISSLLGLCIFLGFLPLGMISKFMFPYAYKADFLYVNSLSLLNRRLKSSELLHEHSVPETIN